MLPSIEAVTSLPGDVPATGSFVSAGLEPLGRAAQVPEGEATLRGFSGKLGEALQRTTPAGTLEVAVGLGDAAKVGALELRRAAATFARSLTTVRRAALDLRGVRVAGVTAGRAAQAIVEGILGASYRFERYHASDEEPVEAVVLVVDENDLAEASRGIERGRAIGEAVSLARELATRAPTDLTPRVLADEAVAVADRGGCSIEIYDEKRAVAERLGGLLGVARGSDEPPRLIKMTYEPDESVARPGPSGSVPTIVLVGKGITFDSGGLSLKTPDGMIGMKTDMSGAAAVLATVGACRALGVGARVVAIAPVTENMPGGSAIKPGDVLTIRNGKTIEVLNTDAEGRLVLSDGLVLATEEEPDAIVDVATLTGACMVALGTKVAGLMGNDSRVVAGLEAASERSGEPLWRLPLPREYRKDIDSDIADIKNMGKARQAGALVAGLILEEFVDERPWAHLDIAGPSRSDEERFETRKGPTGFGVRTLLEFVETFALEGEPTADHVGVG